MRNRRSRPGKRRAPPFWPVAWIALAAAGPPARADEGGTPFWVSGQYASLAAIPPSPGWSIALTGYGYDGSAGETAKLPLGTTIAYRARERAPSMSAQAGYAGNAKVLGGQPFLGLSWGLGGNRVRADVTSPAGRTASESDTLRGGTDLYPIASLAWASGSDNAMVYLTGDIPVGAYRASRLANVGIGHAAVDAGGGYTYYDAGSGAELSVVAGTTFNSENPQTHYRNGVDAHLDWAASGRVAANWAVGIAGYVYGQLTGDSGSGAVLGPFKSRVAAVGPEVGYQFSVGAQQWQANLRAYREFGARNRYQGSAIFATLDIPLGPPGR